MKNLIFIGMPGSGKTTISRKVAAKLERPWFDTDREIEHAEYKTIAEIFSKNGEEYFRRLETDKIVELTEREGIVLAVGGGAVLRNGTLLKHNSYVFYLERDIKTIATKLRDGTRPLTQNEDDLKRLYERRKSVYESLADYTIDNNGNMEEVLETIMALIL